MTAAVRVLSLGAGVQSTALYLLAVDGLIPRPDVAVFADTGWEPASVYAHLDALADVPDGIPIVRVSAGNIRRDALDPEHRFASMPLFVRNPDGSDGMARRQCTSEYKVKPIKRAVRDLLGYPHPTPVPRGVYADQLIGISRDEVGRVRDSDVRYARNVFPLLDLDGAADGRPGWTRADCQRYLTARGWGSVGKSACIGCPYHGNAEWRRIRDEDPESWADAVAFDAAIRGGSARATAAGRGLRGEFYLHRSRVPLDLAPIDRVTGPEWQDRQTDLLGLAADQGCSPFGCRSESGPA